MCGRFASVTPPEVIRHVFGTVNSVPIFPARWNLAPTQEMLVVRLNPVTRERSLDIVKWGLIPHWAKDATIGAKLINARAEGLATKPSFTDAFRNRRCLIPADAFYEWKKGTPKRPYAIRPAGGGLFAFAGLWENWRNPEGVWVRTATVVTTDANSAVVDLHDRMPVLVQPDDWSAWLGEVPATLDDLAGLMIPAAADGVAIYPVGMDVGNVKREGPELLAPLTS